MELLFCPKAYFSHLVAPISDPTRMAARFQAHQFPVGTRCFSSSNQLSTTMICVRFYYLSSEARANVNSALPEGIVTYCFPSNEYVIGEAKRGEPVWKCQSSFPACASTAIK